MITVGTLKNGCCLTVYRRGNSISTFPRFVGAGVRFLYINAIILSMECVYVVDLIDALGEAMS